MTMTLEMARAIAEEREACATIAEDHKNMYIDFGDRIYRNGWREGAERIAAAIRARGGANLPQFTTPDEAEAAGRAEYRRVTEGERIMHSPYSREDLAAMKSRLEEELHSVERQYPGVRPLPPMGEEETKALLLDLMAVAATRMLTEDEDFLSGQLLAAYRMAIEARMLGRPAGRYYVIAEADLDRLQGLAGG